MRLGQCHGEPDGPSDPQSHEASSPQGKVEPLVGDDRDRDDQQPEQGQANDSAGADDAVGIRDPPRRHVRRIGPQPLSSASPVTRDLARCRSWDRGVGAMTLSGCRWCSPRRSRFSWGSVACSSWRAWRPDGGCCPRASCCWESRAWCSPWSTYDASELKAARRTVPQAAREHARLSLHSVDTEDVRGEHIS